MTERVIAAYDRNAAQIATGHSAAGAPWAHFIDQTFGGGELVLEVGAGIGDVAARLMAKGCSVVACEPSAAMRSEAVKRHPEISGCLFNDALPLASGVHEKEFDGVVCLAVLMHLSEEQLFDAAFSLRLRLKPGGRLLLSVSEPRDGLSEAREDSLGRFFNQCPAGQYRELFERIGFNVVSETRGESIGVSGPTRWVTWVMERQDARSDGRIPGSISLL